MACFFALLGILLSDLPQVQIETLKSGAANGTLKSVSATQVTVGDKSYPVSDVLELRVVPTAGSIAAPVSPTNPSVPATTPTSPVTAPDGTAATAAPVPIEITLSDGSRLTAIEMSFAKGELRIKSPRFGEVSAKKAALKSLRLQADDPKFREAWSKLVTRESKKDLLVVRKENKLDFIAGVAGDITESTVNFLVDGEEFPARREAVYGVIFQPAPPVGKLTATAELEGTDSLQLKSVTLKDEKWQLVSLAGVAAVVPVNQLKSLDYSAGKIRQLSQMDPIDVQYFPFWGQGDPTTEYRRNFSGPLGILTPITLGGKAYPKGLAIHSKTILKYRLGGEYRRFQAMMGIDDFTGQSGHLGDVHLKITGDNKVLYEGDPKHSDPPLALNFDVTGVRDLTILVDYGANLDIGDWLDLADAKVSK